MTTASRVSSIGALGRAGLFISAAAFALVAFSGVAHADATCSTVGGTLLVDHTMNITNDPDSSVSGPNWALDTFARHIQIWQEPGAPVGQYCAKADDSGSFTTNGTISPQNGSQLLSHITGNFSGGTYGTITGGTFSTSTDVSDINCDTDPTTCSNGLTKYWTDTYFGGSETYNYGSNWGWTYTTTSNGTWVNAAAGNTGDIFPVYDTTTATGYGSLSAAIGAANAGDTIQMESDASTTAELTISKALTIDGNGHTLYAPIDNSANSNSNNAAIGILGVSGAVTVENITIDGSGSTKIHGINVYQSSNVTLSAVTSKNNSKAGMVVNGSTVAATNFNTSGNSWGGVNVDPGSGVTQPSVFTLSSGTLSEGTQIWSDGSHVTGTATVTVSASGYTKYHEAGTTAGYVWSTTTPKGATIEGDPTNTLYATIGAAITAAVDGDVINVGPGSYTESPTISHPLTLSGAGSGSSIIDGQVTVDATNTTVSNLGVTNPNGNFGILVNHVDNVTISNNDVSDIGTGSATGNVYGIYFQSSSAGSNSHFTVSGNTVNGIGTSSNGSNGGIGIGDSTGSGAFTSFTVSGNTISDVTANTTAVSPGKGAYGIIINHGASAGGTTEATVTDNTISNLNGRWAHAIALEGNTPNTTVSGNTISGLTSTSASNDAVGIQFEDNTGATSVTTTNNSIDSGTVKYGAVNAATGSTLDLSRNYWATSTPANIVYGPINVEPWWTDAAMTKLGYTVSSSGGAASTTISDDTSVSDDSGDVTVDIPAGTVITGDSGWDGTISVPTTTSVTLGSDKTVGIAIEVGATGHDLTFDKAVKLTFTGQAGKSVGFKNAAGVFTSIDGNCPSPISQIDTLLPTGSACQTTEGADLVVYTKHFSTFVTFTTNTTTSGGGGSGGGSGSSGGGGGGGGGGAPAGSITVAAAPQAGTAITTGTTGSTGATGSTGSTGGQVLGAATYNFRVNLTIGSKGADVEALQQLLVDAGYLDGKLPRGYFGAMTKQAVMKWQKANGISPASGYVGALTRAKLNAGSTPTSSDEQKSMLIQGLTLQLNNLMARLNALMAGTTTATTTATTTTH